MTKFNIGVCGIIFDPEKRILLCHRHDYDLWNLPGGGAKDRESPWEEVVRETKEETGLDIKIENLLGVYFKPETNEVNFAFIGKPVSGELSLNDEADKLEYFAFSELPKYMSAKQIERIEDALEYNGQVITKTQTGPSSKELAKNNA